MEKTNKAIKEKVTINRKLNTTVLSVTIEKDVYDKGLLNYESLSLEQKEQYDKYEKIGQIISYFKELKSKGKTIISLGAFLNAGFSGFCNSIIPIDNNILTIDYLYENRKILNDSVNYQIRTQNYNVSKKNKREQLLTESLMIHTRNELNADQKLKRVLEINKEIALLDNLELNKTFSNSGKGK
jgi:hypothetical protein